jgi:hypothetical protein
MINARTGFALENHWKTLHHAMTEIRIPSGTHAFLVFAWVGEDYQIPGSDYAMRLAEKSLARVHQEIPHAQRLTGVARTLSMVGTLITTHRIATQ